jgi:hypothetical protein
MFKSPGSFGVFLYAMNVRYWPIGDAQVDEILAVRAAANDPKRTFVNWTQVLASIGR